MLTSLWVILVLYVGSVVALGYYLRKDQHKFTYIFDMSMGVLSLSIVVCIVLSLI